MIGKAPIIQTREDLKAYIKRNLGYPVVNVEIHDSQLDDCINETVAEYVQYAYDGVEKRFLVLELQEGENEYQLPYSTQSVLGVHLQDALDYASAPSDLFSPQQFIANDILRGGFSKVDLLTIELTQQFIENMQIIFGKKISFNYNSITKKLFIEARPYVYNNPLDGSMNVIVEYFRSINVDEELDRVDEGGAPDPLYTNIFDVKWIQQYSTALARRQWGYNLLKYEGSTLPQGLVYNASAIVQEANMAIDKLAQQLQDDWVMPTDFFIG